MRTAFCANVADVPTVIAAGFDCTDLRTQTFFGAHIPEDEYRSQLVDLDKCDIQRVSGIGLFPKNIRLIGENPDTEAAKEYVKITFRRAGEIGLENIVFGSVPARNLPEGFDPTAGLLQMVEFSRFLADEAAKYNMTVVMEPLRKKAANTFNTMASGALLVQKVDHPNFKLLTDYFHFVTDDNDLTALALSVPYIHHAHIATAANRRYPGVEESDFSGWMHTLKAGGYDGVISVEGGGDITVEVLGKAVEVIKKAWQEA